jgi:probable rRNA maturation factor
MAINYFVEDVDKLKLTKRKLNFWIKSCINSYGRKTGNINFIFCSDEYLRDINIQYLKHDYCTDIITFDNTEKLISSGDIYISTDRVYDNAKLYKVDFVNELRRVIIHGILHLIGFKDKKKDEKAEMRNLEDHWLKEYNKNV